MNIWLLRLLCVFSLIFILPINAHALEKRVPDSGEEMVLSFAPLVQQASPAVVNIYTKKKIQIRKRSPFSDDPLFQYFFGQNALTEQITEKIESSLGSGVIINDDGLVITCHHVIDGSDEITVVLNDRREFDAKVILLDQKTDLALLRINTPKPLPFLELADSDLLEVGDIVLAIGNPFGVGQTVTNGIVSALARTTVGASDYQFFIQTDASINPGNSGGALVNAKGKLVGINSAIFSKSGGSHGVGFAIPSNMAATVIKSATGEKITRVVRPWVGITVQPLTKDLADSLGMERPIGALIAQMHPKGTAAQSGLKVGDVVVAVDQHAVLDEHGLQFRVATYDINSEAMFKVLRNGEIIDVAVKMLAPPEQPERDVRVLKGQSPLEGATVANLSPALADELGVNLALEGVMVLRVGNGVAKGAGLNERDFIRKLNGEVITSTDQLQALLNDATGRWEISLQRGNRILSIIWGGRL